MRKKPEFCAVCGDKLGEEWLECDECRNVVCQTKGSSMSGSCFHNHLIGFHNIDWTIDRSENYEQE